MSSIREALAAAKARGVKLGVPKWWQLREHGNAAAVATLKGEALERAEEVLPIIEEIRAAGVTTNAGIAEELKRRRLCLLGAKLRLCLYVGGLAMGLRLHPLSEASSLLP